MDFHFEVDGVVDLYKFDADWETQRALNGWPPFDFRWDGNRLMASINSNNIPESELRKMLNFSLGPQGRRLNEV
jgi:hypothetical protein